MEQRPHPDHDRRVLRRELAGLLVAFPSLPLFAVEPWGAWVGAVGFLTGAGVLLSIPVNGCRCPSCGRVLRRALDAAAFRCGGCGVTWTTRCYGGGNSEA